MQVTMTTLLYATILCKGAQLVSLHFITHKYTLCDTIEYTIRDDAIEYTIRDDAIEYTIHDDAIEYTIHDDAIEYYLYVMIL